MACDTSITRPLDSFIKYFYDIKPYHTKILEVIEQYHFTEDLHVEFQENMETEVVIENDPLCKGVGFGLDFDDECGFDALDCCDLFDCAGGFGLIYDNSDKLLEIPVDDINVETGEITVSGYHVYDTYINIKSVPNTNTIVLDGDYSQYFDHHKMFWVVRRNTYPVLSQTTNTITVEGDIVAQVLSKRNLELQLSGTNDGHYGVTNATYSSGNTTITLNRELPSTSSSLGRILVASSNKNNGIYQITGYTIQGTETHLNLKSTTQAPLTDADLDGVHGSIRLRTATLPMRRVWVGESSGTIITDRQWRIVSVKMDAANESTIITVDGRLNDTLATPTLRIYGYESGAGFDGDDECSQPKPFNVHTYFSEHLFIEIESDEVPVSPTPTATLTATPTVTPTPSPGPAPAVEGLGVGELEGGAGLIVLPEDFQNESEVIVTSIDGTECMLFEYNQWMGDGVLEQAMDDPYCEGGYVDLSLGERVILSTTAGDKQQEVEVISTAPISVAIFEDTSVLNVYTYDYMNTDVTQIEITFEDDVYVGIMGNWGEILWQGAIPPEGIPTNVEIELHGEDWIDVVGRVKYMYEPSTDPPTPTPTVTQSPTPTVSVTPSETPTVTATPLVTQSPPAEGNELENGVTISGINGDPNSEKFWTITVPSSATTLVVSMNSDTGDADLYVKLGSPPTHSDFDCRPYQFGSNETCTITVDQGGIYHIRVYGFQAYTNLSLTATYQ